MKTLMVMASMLVSLSTFASEQDAVDSFLSVLPIGHNLGVDDQGRECSMTVSEVNFPQKAILITGENNKNKVSKMVAEGSEFLFRAHRKEFIQTHRHYVNASKTSYFEKIVRTLIAGDNLLYVVTATETNINGRFNVDKVECVVDLK